MQIFLKNQSSHFYPFLSVCHQVQFKKNPVNNFRENVKIFDFGPKNDPLFYFEYDMNLP